MSEATGVRATGRCDCGGVAFDVTGPLRDVWNCHCPRCRRLTGHFMAATATHPDHVVFRAQDTLRWYEPADGVRYGFCGTCGATLFWRVASRPEHLVVAAGSLDPPTGLRTTKAWWCDHASDYHERQPDVEEHGHEG